MLSGGQASDVQHAFGLIEGIDAASVLADKAYDANELLGYLHQRGIESVIPPTANRCELWDYDRHTYKNRKIVEGFFARLRQFRRIATRYEKLARNFFGMLSLACAYSWMAWL